MRSSCATLRGSSATTSSDLLLLRDAIGLTCIRLRECQPAVCACFTPLRFTSLDECVCLSVCCASWVIIYLVLCFPVLSA